jgi:hypothetical protein
LDRKAMDGVPLPNNTGNLETLRNGIFEAQSLFD